MVHGTEIPAVHHLYIHAVRVQDVYKRQLTAVVAAVLVQFYLYIGFLQLSALRKPELDVFYGQAAVQPLLLSLIHI